jgi:hypothetical protein
LSPRPTCSSPSYGKYRQSRRRNPRRRCRAPPRWRSPPRCRRTSPNRSPAAHPRLRSLSPRPTCSSPSYGKYRQSRSAYPIVVVPVRPHDGVVPRDGDAVAKVVTGRASEAKIFVPASHVFVPVLRKI